VQQKWRSAYENKSWARAIAAGEVLIARDTMAARDSVFYLKLGAAYRAFNKPFKAIEDVISREELVGLSEGYKQIAGYSKEALRR